MRYSHRPTHSATPAKTSRPYPALILLDQQRGLGAPLGVLTRLLAQTLAEDFGDAVIVLHVLDSLPVGEIVSDEIEPDEHRADHISLKVPPDAVEAFEMVRMRSRYLSESYAYIFLDLSRCKPHLSSVLLTRLAVSDLGLLARRLVFLTRDRAAPRPPSGWAVLRTDVLDPRPDGDQRPAPEGLRGSLTRARHMAGEIKKRLGGDAIEPQGEPYPESRISPEWCRVRMDLPALRAKSDVVLGDLAPTQRESISRWGRAVTYRRVGVALGGGGSWGYAHVALMLALIERGIPIDLVGGSSSGTLMGAYFCALGKDGLELTMDRAERFAKMASWSFVTSTILDITVEEDLGTRLLEDLEIALLPVATNLTKARAEVITRSTIGSAVRASGSAPGLFAATITKSGLYVDGAVTDNVPVVLVERMGADLCIACNPLPPPLSVNLREPTTPLQDFLAEFNLLNRLRDIYVSFTLMLHDFGDCEPSETRVVYDPGGHASSLSLTSAFERGRAVVHAVERDPLFQETIRRAVEAWQRLARARAPQVLSDSMSILAARRIPGFRDGL